MKIISKFKDYYDYFQGIYGMDEKLVLDRTEFHRTPEHFSDSILRYSHNDNRFEFLRFWICDYCVEGVFNNGRFLYGKEIGDMVVETAWGRANFPDYYHVRDFYSKNRTFTVLKKPTLFSDLPHGKVYFKEWKEEKCPNTIMNCPILFEQYNSFYKFPILKDYQFHKVFSDFQMWTMLTEWLGREKKIKNNQTNQEKILSNGFDLKTSFRHPIK